MFCTFCKFCIHGIFCIFSDICIIIWFLYPNQQGSNHSSFNKFLSELVTDMGHMIRLCSDKKVVIFFFITHHSTITRCDWMGLTKYYYTSIRNNMSLLRIALQYQETNLLFRFSYLGISQWVIKVFWNWKKMKEFDIRRESQRKLRLCDKNHLSWCTLKLMNFKNVGDKTNLCQSLKWYRLEAISVSQVTTINCGGGGKWIRL